MTEQEYLKKKYNIATSDAPFKDREKAMKELEEKYSSNSTKEAQRQFLEAQPEPIKEID